MFYRVVLCVFMRYCHILINITYLLTYYTCISHWTFRFMYDVTADMTGNNSTGLNDTTSAAAFWDPGWLLAAALEVYSQFAVIGIALIGTAANAMVLYALIVHNARETKKRVVNLLIINQNLLDLCCCLFAVIIAAMRVSNIYLTGALGYILCSIFISANAAYCMFNASIINLMALTVERYLKVVYPFWSKKNFKRWMIYAAIVFSWVAGILSVGPVGFATSIVVEGTCLGFQLFFEIDEIKAGYGTWSFLSFSLLPVVFFVYCYGHIVVVMRKQIRVMAGHNVEGSAQSASHAQSKRIKWNIIKTMIIVSAFFVVCWFPHNVYIMVVDNVLKSSELTIGYIVTLFLPYINISLNPFIYAIKHEGVRQIFARMIICRKRDNAVRIGGTSGNSVSTGTKNTNRAVVSHK